MAGGEKLAHIGRINPEGHFEVVDLLRASEKEAEGHFRITLEDGEVILIPVTLGDPFVIPGEITAEYKAEVDATWNQHFQPKESPSA